MVDIVDALDGTFDDIQNEGGFLEKQDEVVEHREVDEANRLKREEWESDRIAVLDELRKLGKEEANARRLKEVKHAQIIIDLDLFQVRKKDPEIVLEEAVLVCDTLYSKFSRNVILERVLRSSNTRFVSELERTVMENKPATILIRRSLFDQTPTLWPDRILFVLRFVQRLCEAKKERYLRSVFYASRYENNIKLFSNQTESDEIINDVCCLLSCNRRSLLLQAEGTGMVGGLLSYEFEGRTVDCSVKGGVHIPPDIDLDEVKEFKVLQRDGKEPAFILLVEKKTIFDEIVKDQSFIDKFPCIVITGKGQPDVATRRFLNIVQTVTELVVLGIVDCDLYGLMILLVYLFGSDSMAFDSKFLATPDIKWLALRPSDLEKYSVPLKAARSWLYGKSSEVEADANKLKFKGGKKEVSEEKRQKRKASNLQMAEELKKKLIQVNRKAWADEVDVLVNTDACMDLEGLDVMYLGFIVDKFLGEKIVARDWLGKDVTDEGPSVKKMKLSE